MAAAVALAGMGFIPDSQAQLGLVRVGAICMDGWQSRSTGSGTCSHHGGVMCWLMSDGSCQ
jgi:hypothetical protein